MKRIFFALLLGALLFVPGCLEDVLNSDTNKDGNTSPPLAETKIGGAGGTLSGDGFSLVVPAGAFSSEADLKLYRETAGTDLAGHVVSPAYRVDGLPADFVGTLEVRLSTSGALTGEPLIAMKSPAFVGSLNDSAATYAFLPATADSASVICELIGRRDKNQGKPNAAASAGYAYNPTFLGLSGYYTYTSNAGHFVIYFPDSWMQTNRPELLGGYLEAARDRLAQMGFDLSRRSWPVEVCVRKLAASTYGLHEPDLRGDNYARLSFNMDKWSPVEMQVTAAHELFHLVQYLYDPRNQFSKAKLRPAQLWLNEACSVWFEELFAPDPATYVSAARAGQEEAPLHGMQKGAVDGDAAQHGYGMSAMIHYLVGRQGMGVPLSLYQKIERGESPTRAVLETGPQAPWYNDFLTRYVTGEIYGITRGMATGWNAGMFRIQSKNDVEASFPGTYPDLSGKLYMVRLDYAGIDDTYDMHFSLGGASDSLTVFKFSTTDPHLRLLHGPEAGSLTLAGTEIKALRDGGWHLLVLVTNMEATDPYVGSKPLTLTVNLPGNTRVMDILRNTAYLDLTLKLPVTIHETPDAGDPNDFDDFKTMELHTVAYYTRTWSDRDLLSWSGTRFTFHGQDSLETTDGHTRNRWSLDASGEFDVTGTLLKTMTVQYQWADLIADEQLIWHVTLSQVPVSESPDSTYTDPPHGYVHLSTVQGPGLQAYVNEFGWRKTHQVGTGWGYTDEATKVQWNSSSWAPLLNCLFSY